MESACRRLRQGDTTSLPDILDLIEASQQFPIGKRGTDGHNALTALLIQEGLRLRHSNEIMNSLPLTEKEAEFCFPTQEAFMALRILAVVGSRQSTDGIETRGALLALGLQRCRDMTLDAYFTLPRWQRYFAILFAKLLTSLYGCQPQDILVRATSVNLLMNALLDTAHVSQNPGMINSLSLTENLRDSNTPPFINREVSPNQFLWMREPRNPDAPSSPDLPQGAQGQQVRRGNIQNRSLQYVSIPGTSNDIPLQQARRFRELPKKAINVPFPVNPLYEEAPTRRLDRDTLITAQFPTPVLLFTVRNGIGCSPQLPTVQDFERNEAWYEQFRILKREKGTAAAKGSSNTGMYNSVPSHSDAKRRAMILKTVMATTTPLNSYPVNSEPSVSDAPPIARNEAEFLQMMDTSDALPHSLAADYGKCLDSPLLQLYLEKGRLVSWGCNSNGALGSQRNAKALPNPSHPPQLPTVAPGVRRNSAPLAQGYDESVDCAVPSPPTTAKTSKESDAKNYICLPAVIHVPSSVAQIACGDLVTYIITVDGVLYSCGRSESGQLGIGERSVQYLDKGVGRFQRVILKDSERVTRVAAGVSGAIALTTENFIYSWGNNLYGQCVKMPDSSRILTPIRFRTGKYKAIDICFGQFFGVVVFDDGVVGTWGISSMLGTKVADEVLEDSLAPDHNKCSRKVVHLGLLSSSKTVVTRAGPWHALAITECGEVFTWGVGRNGRLGHGSDSSEVQPRLVEGLRTFFAVDASCGNYHTVVLTATGNVLAFGENTHGQLGLRGRQPRRTPTLMHLPGRVVAVSCGKEHTCVLLADGDVIACGTYRACGIGMGYGTRFCGPIRILTNYITMGLNCGPLHSLAMVLNRRTALLRIGCSSIDELSRMESLAVRSGVRCVCSGIGFLVVVSDNNSVVTIGRGELGQLGIGDCMRPRAPKEVTVSPTFSTVALPPNTVVHHVQCGPDFVLLIDSSAEVYAWGNNDHCQLGLPLSVSCVYTPVQVAGLIGHHIVQVACGETFSLALDASGEVFAQGEYRLCGMGEAQRSNTHVEAPSRIPALQDIVAIAAGRRHAIAMNSTCTIFAWGEGVLGACSTHEALSSVSYTPVRVAISQNICKIGCGPSNSFVINDEGELWVWGTNTYGECGVASEDSDSNSIVPSPTCVAREVRDAAFSARFGVVIFQDGQLRVSGQVRHGSSCYDLPTFHSTPQPTFSVDVNDDRHRRPVPHSAGSPSLPATGNTLPTSLKANTVPEASLETFSSPVSIAAMGNGGKKQSLDHNGLTSSPRTVTLMEQSISGYTLSLSAMNAINFNDVREEQNPLAMSQLLGSVSRGYDYHLASFDRLSSLPQLLSPVQEEPNWGRLVSMSPPQPPPLLATPRASISDLRPVPFGIAETASAAESFRRHRSPTTTTSSTAASSVIIRSPARQSSLFQPPPPPPPRCFPLSPRQQKQQDQRPLLPPPQQKPPQPQLQPQSSSSTTGGVNSRTANSKSKLFGLRSFCGWEQVYVVVEKRRPTCEEVGMAQRGLQLLLHQSDRGYV